MYPDNDRKLLIRNNLARYIDTVTVLVSVWYFSMKWRHTLGTGNPLNLGIRSN